MKRNALLGQWYQAALLMAMASVAPSAMATPSRTFSTDLMMMSEGIGEAVFTPNGERLLVERWGGYAESWNGGWSLDGDERSTLLSVDLDEVSPPRPVQAADERTWISALSPSGRLAVIGWFDGTAAKVGIYDTRSGELRKFEIPMGVSGFESHYRPVWLSDEEFILVSPTLAFQQLVGARVAHQHARTARLVANTLSGDEAGVTVLGSGPHWSAAQRGAHSLLRVNARTGTAATLAEGEFAQLSLSPDRRRLAVLRRVDSVDVSDVPLSPLHYFDANLQLTVFDLEANGSSVLPCEDCNVTYNSMRWSPQGTKLFFSTRAPVSGNLQHENFYFNFGSLRLSRFPSSFELKVEEDRWDSTYVVPFVWLTDDIGAVRVIPGGLPDTSGETGGSMRHDWYAVPLDGAPTLLTSQSGSLAGEGGLGDFVAVHEGRLLLMADGDLWQISPDGARRNLTADIPEDVSPWCSYEAHARQTRQVCRGFPREYFVRNPDEAALEQGWLTLRTVVDGEHRENLIFLNVRDGRIQRISGPPGAQLVSASPLAQAALFLRTTDDGDELLMVDSGATRVILRINNHLQGVARSDLVGLVRREPGESQDRYDWLLLPPDHEPGQRHPLLVYFYPDTAYSEQAPAVDLRDVLFNNPNIPAAKGYAVLMASMKISSYGQPGNPMTEMHEQLVRAAQNAVEAGYADPDRWALMGQSYGGYGTNSVITQTNAFRAAIASASISNLTSAYATSINHATELDSSFAISAMLAETGQFRMGGAPWADAERYVRNSPVFFADRVNTPLLLIHGENDGISSVEAEQMFHALLRQNKDAAFLRYWGEGHRIESPANIRDLWERVIPWLDEHLGVQRDSTGAMLSRSGVGDPDPD